MALGPDGNGNLNFSSPNYSTQASLDAEFNNGTYTFNINGGSGSYSTSYAVTGNAYPASPPTITNTNWSGGALLINPAQDFTLTWNSFNVPPGSGDVIQLSDNGGAFNYFYTSNTTSQLFPAGSFTPNSSYAFTLGFANDTLNNTSSTAEAALYIDDTSFTVQTAPEPSTNAILLIGIGFLYFVICRRKKGPTSP